MKKIIVSRTLSVHKEHEVLLKLEAAGLTEELAQRLIESKGNNLAAKVVRLIQDESEFAAPTVESGHQEMPRFTIEDREIGSPLISFNPRRRPSRRPRKQK